MMVYGLELSMLSTIPLHRVSSVEDYTVSRRPGQLIYGTISQDKHPERARPSNDTASGRVIARERPATAGFTQGVQPPAYTVP
jgi:hypothetical protein